MTAWDSLAGIYGLCAAWDAKSIRPACGNPTVTVERVEKAFKTLEAIELLASEQEPFWLKAILVEGGHCLHSQSTKKETAPRRTWPPGSGGGSSPAPGTRRRSKSDKATAFAEEATPLTVPSSPDATSQSLQNGISRRPNSRGNFVSSDHLPPTSPAITTIRTRPFLPLHPKETTLPPQLPSSIRGDVGEVQVQVLQVNGRPVLHPPDRSEQPHSPLQIPCDPTLRVSNMLLCGGQTGQGNGFKSNGGQTEAKAGGDGAEGEPRMVLNPFSRRGELVKLSRHGSVRATL